MRKLLVMAALLAVSTVDAFAHEVKIGSIRVSHPWCTLMTAEPGALAAHIKIANDGETDDRLIGAELSTARGARFRLAGVEAVSVRVPAGASLVVKPSAVSLTFTGLTSMPVEGEVVAGRLIFEKAGVVLVEFEISG